MSQGHTVLHIAFFIVSFIIRSVKRSEREIECMVIKTDPMNGKKIKVYTKEKIGLNDLMDELKWSHFFCGFLLTWSMIL